MIPVVTLQLAAILLAWSALSHSRVGSLQADIRAQRLLPIWTVAPIARILPVIEACGAIALVLTLSSRSQAIRLALTLPVASLFMAFAVYAVVLRARRPGAPCGCGMGGTEPASVWTIARAASLGVSTWLAAAFTTTTYRALSPGEVVAATCASITIAALAAPLLQVLASPRLSQR